MQAVQIIPARELNPVPTMVSAGRFARIVARAESCIARIGELIDQGYTCSAAVSFGKDSSVVLILMLEAIRRRVEAGAYVQPAFVTHSNTLRTQRWRHTLTQWSPSWKCTVLGTPCRSR